MRRELQFHKGRSILLVAAIALVSMLCTFSFALGFMIRSGLLYSYRVSYGSTSDIVYYGMNDSQAAAVSGQANVKKTVSLQAVGVLSDDMMEYRSVKLAPVSQEWARATEAVPMCGRMPEHGNEIAMDELTLQSLAIPRQEGTELTLRWTPADGREEREDSFRLCGWWSSDMGASETCAWITPKMAKELCPETGGDIMLGVALYRPGDLEEQAEELLQNAGVSGVDYTTNLAYNKARLERVGEKTVSFFWINVLVAVCGVLMVYNVVRISAGQNVRFYGRIKSLGMSPRQIGRFLFWQTTYLCMPSIPAGWIIGYAVHIVTAPYVLHSMGGKNPALWFWDLRPFICSGILTWMTTWVSCALSARFVSKISPVKAMAFYDRAGASGGRRGRRMTKVPLMALTGLSRNRRQLLAAAGSMLFAMTLMCVHWTQYVSTDEAKYMEDMIYCDYLIADSSAVNGMQRYNPLSCSITPKMVEKIGEHEAVKETGIIRTVEVPMHAGLDERAEIVENFESVNSDGTLRKEVMSDSPDWCTAYERFCESGDYIGIVTGVDGLGEQVILEEGNYVEGAYDAGLFATGEYVVAAGASTTEFISTPPVGSKVEIGGRSFEIMASVEYKSRIVTGADSREAQFNVSYYIPVGIYEELFPHTGIRNMMINIDQKSQEMFEDFVAELVEGTGTGVSSYDDFRWNFQNALFHNYIIPMLVGMVLLLIGILNFGNALVSGMILRGREFAVYESLGMTRKQIRKLFLWEGALQAGIQIVVLVPAVSMLTWVIGRWWAVNSASSWCVTWRYSLLPMWLFVPVLMGMSAVIPLCCMRVVMKESLSRRLRVEFS